MNKVGFIKLIILFILLVNQNAYGQQRREISKQEFSDAYSKAIAKTKTFAYRIVSKNEVFYSDEIKSVENGTSKFVPPDRNHFVFEVEVFGFKKTFSNELIRIGNDSYTKTNGSGWKKQTKDSSSASATNKSYAKPVERNSRFFLTENVSLGGQAVNLYELSVEYIFTNRTSSNQTKESINNWVEKRWISDDGRILKMELEAEWRDETPKRGNRRVSTYEYDANIKIEAPQMTAQEKK